MSDPSTQQQYDDGESMPSFRETFHSLLRPVASLKLTVVLMALAIFIVLAGTFAQVEHDIWTVIDAYFRINLDQAFSSEFPWIHLSEFFIRIEPRMFFPASMFPAEPSFPDGLGWLKGIWPQGAPDWMEAKPGKSALGFWFPRGWTIGVLMMLNLAAAHTVRFKIQAQSARLWGGLGVILLGLITTWVVIASGSDADGIQNDALLSYDTLWVLLRFLLFALAAPAVYGALSTPTEKSGLRVLLGAIAVLLCAAGTGSFFVNQFSDPSMRIVYQLFKGLLAALVLLVGCVMVFRKRAGIVLLHAGIGLLMLYEVIVGTMHVESRMTLFEGESVNYSFDIRTTELAFVNENHPEGEQHIVISAAGLHHALATGEPIDDPRLPVKVEPVEWLRNSRFGPLDEGEENPATAGVAARAEQKLVSLTAATGTDGDAVDLPGLYARFIDRATGKDLGVYAFNAGIDLLQKVHLPDSDVEWKADLRFQRLYKPYTVYLHSIRQNNYSGTTRAQDYRATITLTDENGNVVLDHYDIWMNNPLRYANETYYQSSIRTARSGSGIERGTEFQVVLNKGWMAPYVACMVVAVGMLYQFGEVLLRFLNRYLREAGASTPVVGRRRWTISDWVFPAATVGLGLMFVGAFAMLRPKVVDEFRVGEFGQLPAVAGGRGVPLDTLARNRLMMISDRQTFKPVDPDPHDREVPPTLPAIVWLLDMAARPDVADTHPVFRIENDDLTKSLGMEITERRAYAFNDFRKSTDRLIELAKAADQTPKEQRTVLQRKQLELFRRLQMYHQVKDWFYDPWEDSILAAVPQLKEEDASGSMRLRAAEMLAGELRTIREEAHRSQFPLLMPTGVDADERTVARIQDLNWEPYPVAAGHLGLEELLKQQHSPATVQFQAILKAWESQDSTAFNRALEDYRTFLDKASNRDLQAGLVNVHFDRVDFEEYFNRFAPFNALSWAYLGVFVAVAIGWLLAGFGKAHAAQIANRSGLWLSLLLMLVHAWAIAGRIYISGRPPVTNLYSSAVFIGLAAVLGGILFEAIFRLGFGNVVSAFSGFMSLRIAYGLMSDGDTLGVLEPVLDTTFWLATHVVCITLGYAAAYVAGLLGVLYILRGSRLGLFTVAGLLVPVAALLFARGDGMSIALGSLTTLGLLSFVAAGIALLKRDDVAFPETLRRQITRMTYGTLCAATLLSFVGTVLGGLWADDSWGRFWGWDPKENGALIIVLWTALILHARWDRLIGERGVAVLSVLGNVVVSWSWFGVNELGIGLHSYGFTEGRLFWLVTFCTSQVVIAALGCLPWSTWWPRATRPADPEETVAVA